MATSSYNTPIDVTTDAGFRTVMSEFFNDIQTNHPLLVQTADTGQVNLATATRTANVVQHYRIYYLNDSLHATAPIYLKIAFGMHFGNTSPAIRISAGTGSDGSGVLTGLITHANGTTLSSGWAVTGGQAPSSTVLNFPSYVCTNQGFFGFGWKIGAVSGGGKSTGFFTIQRTCDNSGAITSYGYSAIYYNSGGGASLYYQSVNLQDSVINSVSTASSNHAIFPGSLATGSTQIPGRDIQCVRNQFAYPRIKMGWATLSAVVTEMPVGETTTQTVIGSTPRTFISTGVSSLNASNRADSCILMLYE